MKLILNYPTTNGRILSQKLFRHNNGMGIEPLSVSGGFKYKFLIFLLSAMFFACGEKDYLVTIKTKFGDMHAILYDETPKHKENFIKLAKEGFYDSLIFHRVMKGFMIQGGDPQSKNAPMGIPLGTGGPGYTIPAEINDDFIHEKGALSAARLPDQQNPRKESSGSQFYIVQGKKYSREELTTDINILNGYVQQYLQVKQDSTLQTEMMSAYNSGNSDMITQKLMEIKSDLETTLNVSTEVPFDGHRLHSYTTTGGAPHLDGEYTVFGKIISGLDVIDKISEQTTNPRDRPLEDIIMKVEVREMNKKKIAKDYGYDFGGTIK